MQPKLLCCCVQFVLCLAKLLETAIGQRLQQGRSFVWAPVFAAHLGPHFAARSLIHFSKMGPIVVYSLSHCFLMDLATKHRCHRKRNPMPREKWFLLTCCCHRYTPAMFCDKADQRCCFGNQFAEQAWDECRTVAPPCTEATKNHVVDRPRPPNFNVVARFRHRG